jgi:polar amino acid transport system permease protein
MALSRRQRSRLIHVVTTAVPLVVLALVVVAADWAAIQRAFFQPDIAADLFPKIVTVGVKNTLIYTTLAFIGGLMIGLPIALLRLSSVRPYRWFAATYIELLRGVPAIVTLIVVGFAIPIALDVRVPGKYGPASLALALVAAAYMAETIRAGIQAVPRGQTEAARSLGMSPARTMITIVIPQAFRIMIPPLTNELVLLLKDSSLVFVLGTTVDTVELAKYGREAVSRTFNGTPLTVVAVLYLAISLPLTRLAARLEKRGAPLR